MGQSDSTTQEGTPVRDRAPEGKTSSASGMSAAIISAIESIQTEQVTKSGQAGVFDVIKGISVGYLGEREDQVKRISGLEADLAKATAERDTAREKLHDLRDINVLHTILLAVGTGLLGCYASYDSAGKGNDFSMMLWLGLGSVSLWFAFLIYRIIPRKP